ncbi:MAG: phosphoribosylformylglycinamidine synthase subunit PurS [Geminicoccaceae bacterium]|nr:phosphoribosylformylglycinamidine synthase subunit PurS [Geminicoccaceae bacterium]
MQARVSIRFKDGVLDPEAAAIEGALRGLGFDGVRGVRRVRVIELDLDTNEPEAAWASVERMCERLLANPVIEDASVEILKEG